MKKLSFRLGKKGKIAASGILVCALLLAGAAYFNPAVLSVLRGEDSLKHNGDVLVDSLNVKENIQPEENETETVASDEGIDESFEEERAAITLDRNEVIGMLSDTAEKGKTEGEKERASEEKLKIIQYMEQEKVIENLLSSKGIPETLVIITDNAVNVTVKTQELLPSDAAKIYDIVMRETKREPGEIIIQNKYD